MRSAQRIGYRCRMNIILRFRPEVNVNYMANLKQKERVTQIFYGGHVPVRKKYYYDEQQMSLF